MKRYLQTAVLMYLLAIICVSSACGLALENERHTRIGIAIGLSIVGAAWICCGSFFLYQYFRKGDNS